MPKHTIAGKASQPTQAIARRDSILAPSSNTSVIEDIVRLISPHQREAYSEMLAYELHGRQLPNGELRRVAEDVWLRFLPLRLANPRSRRCGLVTPMIRSALTF
jgi:hypothetical protein